MSDFVGHTLARPLPGGWRRVAGRHRHPRPASSLFASGCIFDTGTCRYGRRAQMQSVAYFQDEVAACGETCVTFSVPYQLRPIHLFGPGFLFRARAFIASRICCSKSSIVVRGSSGFCLARGIERGSIDARPAIAFALSS